MSYTKIENQKVLLVIDSMEA